jgi:hypothetical protein
MVENGADDRRVGDVGQDAAEAAALAARDDVHRVGTVFILHLAQ